MKDRRASSATGLVLQTGLANRVQRPLRRKVLAGGREARHRPLYLTDEQKTGGDRRRGK